MRRSSGVSAGTKIYIVLLIIGLFMVIESIGDAISLYTKEPAKLSDKKISQFSEDEMVNGKALYVIDTIATLETSNTIYGIPYKKKITPYYLVYVNYDSNYENGYYVLMHITNEDMITKMDSMMRSTQAMLMSDSDTFYSSNLTAVGLNFKTESVPAEVKQYMYEYFEEGGVTKAECDKYVADCVLEQIDVTKTKMEPVIGLAVIILPTIIFVTSKIRKKSKTTYVNEIPPSQDFSRYNTPPTPVENSSSASGTGAAKRYSAADYERSGSYNQGEMDSINPDDYFK